MLTLNYFVESRCQEHVSLSAITEMPLDKRGYPDDCYYDLAEYIGAYGAEAFESEVVDCVQKHIPPLNQPATFEREIDGITYRVIYWLSLDEREDIPQYLYPQAIPIEELEFEDDCELVDGSTDF